MSELPESGNQKTPWHLWAAGVFAVLWSSIGAMDYVMTQTQNEAYMSGFTPEQLTFFYGIPTWAVATWALAVWCGVIGGVLLLFKMRLATLVFLTSMISFILTAFQNYVLSNGMEIMGSPFALAFNAVIFLFIVLFFLYARTMQKNGLLT